MDWDFDNITHLARHGVTPEEAEELFDHFLLVLRHEERAGELRFIEVGRTKHGRLLEVVSTSRKGKTRVVTAYRPSSKAIAAYLQEEGGL